MSELFSSWNWYIAGPLIGLFVPLFLVLGNKMFGISSAFEHICSITLPKTMSAVLDYNRAKDAWKLYFVVGIFLGGFISVQFLSVEVQSFLPEDYFTSEDIDSVIDQLGYDSTLYFNKNDKFRTSDLL